MSIPYDDLEVGQVFRFGSQGTSQFKVIVALDSKWVWLDGIYPDTVRNLKVPRKGFLSNVYVWNAFYILTDDGYPILSNRNDFIVGDYRGHD